MSPWIAFALGLFLSWALMKGKYLRLEKFVTDPEVHAELAKFRQAHLERDRAMKTIDKHRELERSIFGELNPLSAEAAVKIPSSSMEQWSASLDRVVAEEQHVTAAYDTWHAYSVKMGELIARHRVNPELRLQLVLRYDPQVFPHG